MTTLQLRDVAIGYPRAGGQGARVVAHDINLRLHRAELTCLLGPNGSGKSTLLRTVSGLQRALQGEVLLDGTPVGRLAPADLAQRLSLVLTDRVQVGALPVWSLVAMGRYPHTGWAGRLTANDEAIVHGAIDAMGLRHLAFRPMSELSDGERQKAMIARALAQQPLVLILDEATAHLDLPHRVELMRLLRELAHERDCAILLSSHDLDLSLRHADRLWLLSSYGEVREGIPEELVLNGGLSATFADSALSFDPWSGAFLSPQLQRARVSVEGKSLAAVWTRRALERLGFSIVAEHAVWRVVLSESDAELLGWSLHGPRSAEGCGLETLLQTLDPTVRNTVVSLRRSSHRVEQP